MTPTETILSPPDAGAPEPIMLRIGDTTERIEALVPVRSVVVASDEDYVAVGQRVVSIDEYIRKVELYWNGTDAKPGPVALAHRTWKDLCDKRGAFLKPAEVQKAADKAAINAWLRVKEERARQAAAEEEERRRQRAQDEVLDAAIDLAATGDPLCAATAEQMLEQPVEVAPAYMPPAAPAVAGLRGPQNRFEVVVEDQAATLLALAASEMLAALHTIKPKDLPSSARKAVEAFLQRFDPAPAGAVAWALRRDILDTASITVVARRQGDRFHLAGVSAGRRKKV